MKNIRKLSIFELGWLVGILEGEGSFMKGPPSCPNKPVVSVNMTDEDVISKVSFYFGIKYSKIKTRDVKWKNSYIAKIRGEKALNLMNIIKPYMSIRRQKQIEDAISCFKDNRSNMKTKKEVIEETLKLLKEKNLNQSEIGRLLKIHRSTVSKIKLNYI